MDADLMVRGLVGTCGEKTVIDGVDLTIGRGEMLVLLAATGAGKTTLLRLLVGFDEPDAGDIVLGGVDIGRLDARDRPIGFVFQNLGLFGHLTVAGNIAYPLRLRPGGGVDRHRVAELIDLVGLAGRDGLAPRRLSPLDRFRALLARGLVTAPRLLLLDAPFALLDDDGRRQARRLLRDVQERIGQTLLLATHDPSDARSLGGRVAVMVGGRIVRTVAAADLGPEPFARR